MRFWMRTDFTFPMTRPLTTTSPPSRCTTGTPTTARPALCAFDGCARTNVPVHASSKATAYFISTPPRGKAPRNCPGVVYGHRAQGRTPALIDESTLGQYVRFVTFICLVGVHGALGPEMDSSEAGCSASGQQLVQLLVAG